jgi:two-component system, NarL family, response regulator DegU
MAEPEIRLLLCEDQRLMRESLRTVLDLEPGLHVVGEAADGSEGVARALALRPDVILMDIKMPLRNGVEATAAITTQMPDARIIILTTFDHDEYVYQAVEAGAMGYLLKDVPATDLIDTIRRVHAGERFIQPTIATRLLMAYQQRGRIGNGGELPEKLSEREMDVLRLLAVGASNRDIADRLVLAEGTIKNHVSNILVKLHAANRTHAATLARERGLI